MDEDDKPYLLIVLGPTGAGKGSLAPKVMEYLNLSMLYISLLIDDLVEQSPYYKLSINTFITKQKDKHKTNSDIIQMFTNPTNKLIKQFSDMYFIARKGYNCYTGTKLSSPSSKNSCNAILDNSLRRAFKFGENIIFESTGSYWPQWLFDIHEKQIKKWDYKIIMAWPIVDICELLFRNKNRAQLSIEKYLNNPKKNLPPRMPDIRIKPYISNIKKIINIFTLLNSKKSKQMRLLLFDNNNEHKLLYDSYIHSEKEGNDIILKYNPYKVEKGLCNKNKKK